MIVTIISQFFLILYLLIIILMVFQAIFNIRLRLFIWEKPEHAWLNHAPTVYRDPCLTFTILLPAKNEEDVYSETIQKVYDLNYPQEFMQIIAICREDDPGTITEAQAKIDELGDPKVQLLVYNDYPVSKPHGLNLGLQVARGDVVTIFDAEDEPHPDILNIINTSMLNEDIDVVQSGVQLMNHNTRWFCFLNVLEYFFWFKSSLHFFARIGMTPLGGNTHVEGTRILLDACKGQKQLQRIVHCSTTGVYGVTGKTPAAEDAPFAPTNPYEATKLQGELLALKAYKEDGLPVSVVRPGLVYGPGDLHLHGLFSSINKGVFRVIDGGRALLHPLYIDDMTTAFLLCAGRPEAIGQSYNIAGERPVTIRELSTAIAHSIDRELPKGSIPFWLANLASDIYSVIPGIKGENAPLTRSRVQFLTHSRVYDISKAKTELYFDPRIGLEVGMNNTTEWYHKHGYL